MDPVLPESSPRSRRDFSTWLKEKLHGVDFVAVGVNFVVGALLLGGLIGALAARDPSDGAPAAEVNAALAGHEDVDVNATEPSHAAAPVREDLGSHPDQGEPGKPDK